MWKKNPTDTENEIATNPRRHQQSVAPTPAKKRGAPAVIGPSIRIKGDVSGQEDLVVEGSIEGGISLEKNDVTIGPSGKAKADVYGKNIRVEGEVRGNLFGTNSVVLTASGVVSGNITAPRVSLENGATFKGSIDMSSGSGTKASHGPSAGPSTGAKQPGVTPSGTARAGR